MGASYTCTKLELLLINLVPLTDDAHKPARHKNHDFGNLTLSGFDLKNKNTYYNVLVYGVFVFVCVCVSVCVFVCVCAGMRLPGSACACVSS